MRGHFAVGMGEVGATLDVGGAAVGTPRSFGGAFAQALDLQRIAVLCRFDRRGGQFLFGIEFVIDGLAVHRERRAGRGLATILHGDLDLDGIGLCHVGYSFCVGKGSRGEPSGPPLA